MHDEPFWPKTDRYLKNSMHLFDAKSNLFWKLSIDKMKED